MTAQERTWQLTLGTPSSCSVHLLICLKQLFDDITANLKVSFYFLQLRISRLLVPSIRISHVHGLYVVESLDGCESALNSVRRGERIMYVVGSRSFRPDIQKLRQMENAVRYV